MEAAGRSWRRRPSPSLWSWERCQPFDFESTAAIRRYPFAG
jgi:hypothetical protein